MDEIIGYEYDDGGREAAGYRGKDGDAVVRAIAILTGAPYEQVLTDVAIKIQEYGYRRNGNITTPKTEAQRKRRAHNQVKEDYGLVKVDKTRGEDYLTYTEAYERHGNCIVSTRHLDAVAIVDGKVRDIFDGRTYTTMVEGFPVTRERKAMSIWLPRVPYQKVIKSREGRGFEAKNTPTMTIEYHTDMKDKTPKSTQIDLDANKVAKAQKAFGKIAESREYKAMRSIHSLYRNHTEDWDKNEYTKPAVDGLVDAHNRAYRALQTKPIWFAYISAATAAVDTTRTDAEAQAAFERGEAWRLFKHLSVFNNSLDIIKPHRA